MTASRQHPDTRCSACGDVIGVYEPMLVVLGEDSFVTSRAAAGESLPPDAPRYHVTCPASGASPPAHTQP